MRSLTSGSWCLLRPGWRLQRETRSLQHRCAYLGRVHVHTLNQVLVCLSKCNLIASDLATLLILNCQHQHRSFSHSFHSFPLHSRPLSWPRCCRSCSLPKRSR